MWENKCETFWVTGGHNDTLEPSIINFANEMSGLITLREVTILLDRNDVPALREQNTEIKHPSFPVRQDRSTMNN